nr:hypothetical protein [Tanacetum cinerariifolium]
MRELRRKLFKGTDDEDAHEHMRRVLKIADLFHFSCVTHDAVMLRVFPITLKGPALRWINRLLAGLVTTWDLFEKVLIRQYSGVSDASELQRKYAKCLLLVKVTTVGEIAIRELRKKLKIASKEKDGIQLNVDKFEHASKSLNKLIKCQIVNNCKKGLDYKNYNAIPPPYTRNFMPPIPDLSYNGLDEFVNKPVVENRKVKSSKEEPKVVRKNDDAPNIKEWVSEIRKRMCLSLKLKRK